MSGADLELMKRYITSEVNKLSRRDQIEILKMLRTEFDEKLRTHTDGTRVNLDVLPKEFIKQLHTFMVRKLSAS